MKTTIVTLLVGALLTIVTGCSGPYAAKSDANALEQNDKVVIMDSKLQSWLRVNAAAKKYTDDGRLIAYAEIRSNYSKSLIIQVQTVFKDGANMALGDATNWQSIVIPQNSVEYYQVASYSAEAKEYTIRIKQGGFETPIQR